jgi:hypothetical protein
MTNTRSEACAGSDVEVNRGEHHVVQESGKPNLERDARWQSRLSRCQNNLNFELSR